MPSKKTYIRKSKIEKNNPQNNNTTTTPPPKKKPHCATNDFTGQIRVTCIFRVIKVIHRIANFSKKLQLFLKSCNAINYRMCWDVFWRFFFDAADNHSLISSVDNK